MRMAGQSEAVFSSPRESSLFKRANSFGSPPFFAHPLDRGVDGLETFVQLQPRGREWRSSIVGDRASDGQTVAADGLGLRFVLAPLEFALDRPDSAHVFLKLLLGMTICLEY